MFLKNLIVSETAQRQWAPSNFEKKRCDTFFFGLYSLMNFSKFSGWGVFYDFPKVDRGFFYEFSYFHIFFEIFVSFQIHQQKYVWSEILFKICGEMMGGYERTSTNACEFRQKLKQIVTSKIIKKNNSIILKNS